MLLKRIYAKPKGWERRVNARNEAGKLAAPDKPEGACLNPPPLAYVALGHSGASPEQKFTGRFLEAAVREGWARMEPGRIVLDVRPEPLVYTIKRAPGRYCLHCGEKLHDDSGGALARAHVAAEHAGRPSPDPDVPAGYVWLTAFECTLDPGQHAKYRRRASDAAPAFHHEKPEG